VPKPLGGAADEEGRDASSAIGSNEAAGEDMDEATRVAIARAYEVDPGRRRWRNRRAGRRRGRRREWVANRPLSLV
jgi:hypothetical protein